MSGDWRGDDDDIPLDNPHAERGLCWACQKPLECSGQPVSTSPDNLIPVCMPCWLSMETYERIDLAIQFDDRADDGPRLFGGHGSN